MSRLETPLPEFHSPEKVASILSVSERTIYDWMRAGLMPSYKFGGCRRISDSDLQAFIDERRDNGQHG